MASLTIQWAPIELTRSGDFAGAIAELGELWPGVGRKPRRDPLTTKREYGIVLLACGLLSIRLGRMSQTNALESAKDMLSESARLLSGEPEESAAQLYLGSAYSDCGEYGEALAIADAALEMEADAEVVVCASVLKATALKRQGHIEKAWKVLESAMPLASAVGYVSRGNFFIECGNLQRRLGNLDQSIIAYSEAESSFLNARSVLYVGVALNNLAGIYLEQHLFNLAHNTASRAAALFQQCRDKAFEAKALDQIANIFLAQDRPCDAEPVARRAVGLLETGDNKAWLAEALITHSRALLRMGTEQAKIQIERATEICLMIGDHHQAAEAHNVLVSIFKNARTLRFRISECLRTIESEIIKRVLRFHDNRIPPTARSLGINRQALENRISKMGITPTKRRRAKSLFSNPDC